MFIKKIGNIREKTPVLESLFDKVAGLLIKDIFIKKRHQQRNFPVNIAKLLRNNFFIEYLLLNILF